MTATEHFAEPATTTRPWHDLLDELKIRYPKVREPIVAALAVLMQNPGIDVDHAKAVAAANGVRITAASVSAAQRLLARQDGGGCRGLHQGDHGPRAAPTNAARARSTRTGAHRFR